MDLKALREKYQQLFLENNRLREEIKRLRTELGMDTIHEDSQASSTVSVYLAVPEPELFDLQIEAKPSAPFEAIDKLSDATTKIRLFQSLFRGRDDVYAKR
jgi:cell division septum initiation protein DivIVA